MLLEVFHVKKCSKNVTSLTASATHHKHIPRDAPHGSHLHLLLFVLPHLLQFHLVNAIHLLMLSIMANGTKSNGKIAGKVIIEKSRGEVSNGTSHN